MSDKKPTTRSDPTWLVRYYLQRCLEEIDNIRWYEATYPRYMMPEHLKELEDAIVVAHATAKKTAESGGFPTITVQTEDDHANAGREERGAAGSNPLPGQPERAPAPPTQRGEEG